MSEKTIVISEAGGNYRIQKSDLTDFELIGILECMIFNLKSINRQAAAKQ